MTSPEAQFERELEVFRTEAETAIQFFYAYLTVHAVAKDHEPVRRLLNTAPLFWNTNLGALQTAAFIALGRVFDQDSTHNLDRLLRIAQDNLYIFSKASLGARRQGDSPTPPDWLAEYLRDAYVPTPDDFRHLRAHVHKHRRVYEAKYRDIRHRLFAHKEVSAWAEINALFKETNIQELEEMLAFLGSLHEALRQLFFNGRKPVLRPSPPAVQERITREAEQVLRSVADVPQQRLPEDAPKSARR